MLTQPDEPELERGSIEPLPSGISYVVTEGS
jgi:hypothetical protein